jgi:two-component system response regulator MprA
VTPSILVVDDDPMIRGLLRQALELDNFRVAAAKDGLDALAQIQASCPDVLVLDVMMPRMDGLAVCQTVRNTPATADLPIILLSGQAHLSKAEMLHSGASKYLSKPVAIDALVASINELLQRLPS